MNEGFSELLIVGIIALLVGVGVGIAISRLFFKGPPQNRRLAQQYDELQTEYTRYQARVNEHFMETAHRMRRLDDSHREMHEHLAQGASRLSNEGDWQDELASPDVKLRLHRSTTSSNGFEPPRDYAPKVGPKDKGTLAEDFGFAGANKPSEEKPKDGEPR